MDSGKKRKQQQSSLLIELIEQLENSGIQRRMMEFIKELIGER